MKNLVKHLNAFSVAATLAAVLFVLSNSANAQCSSTTAYSTSPQSANNTGSTLNWNQDAQSYVAMNGCINGGQYTVSSATSSDYITIRTGNANNGTVITSGITPVTFNATATTIYVINNTNSSCGTHNQSRVLSMVYTVPPTITSIPSSACAGSNFNITGTALSGVTSVSVHGTNAPTFTVNSSTSITVTIPSGATTGTVSVTAPVGSATSSTSLTINALPSDNSGANSSICNGASTTLGASSTTGHTYSWSPATGLSSSTKSNPTANPTTTTTYTLTETITSTGCNAANTTVVTVNPLPSDNSGANQTTCNGTGVTIGASSTTGHTYSWSPSATLSSSTTANPTATPTTATTYTLTETITATGCSAANTTIVTVNAAPSDNSGANQSICNGASVAIGASATTGHTYKWSPSTTLTSSTTSNPTANPTTTTTYTLTETITSSGCSVANTTVVTVNPLPIDNSGANQSTCGGLATLGASSTTGHTYTWIPSSGLSSSTVSNPTCTPTTTTTYTLTETITATGCSAANTTVITVNPVPTDNSGTNQTTCSGTGVAIGASSTTGHTYSWSPSATLNSSSTANPTATPTTTTTYTLTETITATGCSAVNTTVVTVNAAPSDNSGTNQSICIGSSVAIGASSTTGHTYKWIPSTTLTSSTTSNPTANPTTTTTYTLTETITATSCSVANATVVTVNPLPTDNSGANQTTCSGTGVTIGASSTTGHTYSWSPSATLSSSTAANPTANPTTTTTYTLTETITATGCSTSNTTVVTDNTLPTNITPTGTATICSGNSVNISIANSQSGVKYQLRNNSGNASVGSAVAGTGGTITLSTGSLTSTTTFNVLATNATTSCSLQMTGTVTITVNVAPGNNAGSAQSFCKSGSAALGASSTSGHTYSWSPSTGLTSATTSNPTATPTATTTYTLIETITATGCSAVNSVVVTVNSIPTASITPNYCNGGGNVQLTATTNSSYLWSNGGTNSSITVNTAGTYTVTVTNAAGCTATNIDTVAVELVQNGDFSEGNVGFTSAYTYTSAADGLLPEGLYAVGSNANYYHPNFFGTAETGSGNFMIVNGAGTPVTVWSETVTLVPNTYYYFSAWAMSMNDDNPWAVLQFAINGVQVGTIDSLTTGVESTSGPFVWTRFYATWNSGTSTTATLSITDLQTAANGNDFGLSNISCSTLSTVPLSASPSTNAPVCAGSTLKISSNILGGMYPMTYSWTGPNSFTSTSVNDSIKNVTIAASGVYNLTVTDEHGCSVSASASSATVNALPTDITPTAAASSVCTGNSTNIQIANSQSGVNYQLRNNSGNSTVGSAVAGTGSTINLSTGTLTSTTTFNVLATNATSSCSHQMANTVTVTVNQNATISLSSATGTNIQSLCENTPITNITYNIGGGGTGGGVGGLPVGVTGSYSGGVFTISGIPTASGTFNYTVSTTGNCTQTTATGTITVNLAPGNDAGSNKIICSGASTAIGATSTTGHTYSWSPATGLSSSTAANPTAYPIAATTYTLTEIITVSGCSASNTVSVTVNALPGNDAGSNATICSGASASIGATSTTGHTYSWSPSAGLSSSTASNPTANPTATTTYTLTETITTSGCSAANTALVTVNATPGNNAGSNKTICSGASTTIGATSTTGHTYSWSPATGLSSSTAANPSANATASTTYTLTETITASGCSAANTVSVTVNALPGNDAGSNAAVCNGASTSIGATSTTGHTYSWSPATGLSSSTAANPTANPTTATTYTLTETITASGCSAANTVSVTINAAPGNDAGSNATICSGASASIGATSTTGHTYSWSPATGLSSSTTSNPSAYPTSSTTYNLTETITASGCSVANTVSVTVNALPGNDAGSNKTICSGAGTAIGATSTTGRTYSWSPATGLSSSTAANPTANPTTTTTYTLTETITASGCSVANTATVTVNALPANDAGSNAAICNGASTSIGATSTTGHTYSWSPATGLSSSTAANPTANPTTATTYTLTETITTSGCSAANTVSVTINAAPGNDAGSNATICSGASASIGATSTTGHTYSWSPSTGLTSSTTANPSANPTVTTTYTLTETITASGCSTANTASVTVNATPGNDAGSNATNCSGAGVAIGAASTTGHTYSWSPATGLSSSTAANPTASPTATTTYTLTETITASGCSASNTVSVTINAAPGNNAGSNKTICSGASTTIGATSTTGHTYSWSPATGLNGSTISNPSANPTATTTYTLTETITASGCSAANTVSVTTNALPGNDAGSNATVCSGSGVSIGANSTTGHTYSWSPATGLTSSTSSKPTASPTTTTTYTLTETITATGCSAANTAVVSVSTTLSITQQPVNETICSGSGSSVSFTTTASGGSTTFQWWQLKTGLLQFWASLSDGTNSAGASVSGSATNTLTISNVPSSMSGWTYYCVETNVCNSVTSSTVSLTVAGSAGTWIGSISTDWNNAGNWCGSVPTSTTNVIIPSGTTYSPIISGTADCDNLAINSGATLTITTDGHLHLYGTPTVSGTYTNASGTLELDGTSAQTLPAITVDTVIVNNSSGVTLNGNLTVSGLLTFTTGIITTGSNEVNVTNNAIGSIAGYSNSNYIFGNLQRSVSSSGSYDYPLGTSSKYEFINITLSGTSGFTNIVGSFTNSNPLQSLLGSLLSLNILVGGTSITSLLNYGYWTLTPNSTLTAGSYSVEAHEQGQSNSGLTPNSYALVKRHDASSSWAASGTHSNGTQSVTNGVVKAVCSNLTSFSDYSIGYGGGVLPIQLESFTAQKTDDDKDALLLWITAAEEDNNHFDIEVASDVNPNGDLNFRKIGEVPGNGTSFIQHDYSFVDTEANKNGIYYYRLKQVNDDSTFSYSNISPLTFENTNATASVVLSSLYPNPVVNTLFFNVQSQGDMGVDIMVNNMAGQQVFKERIQLGIGSNSFNFDVSELLRAMYLFNLFGDNNNLRIDRKFEKQ